MPGSTTPSKRLNGLVSSPEDTRPAKKAKTELRNKPEFNFDLRGFEGGKQVEISWLRDYILHLLLGGKSENESPPPARWILAKNQQHISRIVALLVPGITAETLGLPAATPANMRPVEIPSPPAADNKLPSTSSLFAYYCPTRAPGDKFRMHSSLQTFTTVSLTPARKLAREKESNRAAAKPSHLTNYLLPRDAMYEAGYPMPSYTTEGVPGATRASAPLSEWQKEDGMIQTPQGAGQDGETKLYGVDCEMVVTEGGKSELARVTVVDQDGQDVYDTLVMPEKPIVDYATQWSGITEERLQGVTTRLKDVQARLAELIDYNTVLCGHSLDCDLRVLKLAHPWVIDTSVAYQHTRGPPFKPSLKWLAQRWLNREIQQPGSKDVGIEQRVGHDSKEDATAAIDLVKLKIEKGPGFGEFLSDTESIFERIGRAQPPKKTAVIDHGTPAQWHGAKADTAIACTTDAEVLDGILDSVPSHDFVFGRLLELSHAIGWSQPSSAVLRQAAAVQPIDDPPLDSVGAESETNGHINEADKIAAAHATLDARIAKLHAALPAHSALIIFTGQSDPRPLGALAQRKAAFDRVYKSKQTMSTAEWEKELAETRWTSEDERILMDQVVLARKGMAFFCVRKTDE